MKPTRAQLAKIHIAKKELQLTDEIYRDILAMTFKVESAKDLSDRQAAQLLELFKTKGWQPKVQKPGSEQKQHNKGKFIAIKPGPTAAQQRKVLAMWNELGYAMEKLHSRCHRQFGVDRFEWLTDQKALHVLITDLDHRIKTSREKIQ